MNHPKLKTDNAIFRYYFYAQSLLEGLREEYPDREDIAFKMSALWGKTGRVRAGAQKYRSDRSGLEKKKGAEPLNKAAAPLERLVTSKKSGS